MEFEQIRANIRELYDERETIMPYGYFEQKVIQHLLDYSSSNDLFYDIEDDYLDEQRSEE